MVRSFDPVRSFVLALACVALWLALAAAPRAQDTLPETGVPELRLRPEAGPSSPMTAPADQLPDTTIRTDDASRHRIGLTASLMADTPALTSGLSWRVFGIEKAEDGSLPLIARSSDQAPIFDLPNGIYVVHAAFGRAGATKKLTVNGQDVNDTLVMDAGALSLNATLTNGATILPFKLKFDIFDLVEDVDGNRQLIVGDVKPGEIVGLNSGVYHVVSTYGGINAVVRSDIRVEAGKMIEAAVEHRAAEVILKLVAEQGGNALADTAWTVYTESAEVVFETVSAYAPMVLAEGNYTAVIKHRDVLMERAFTVETGQDREIEFVLNPGGAVSAAAPG